MVLLVHPIGFYALLAFLFSSFYGRISSGVSAFTASNHRCHHGSATTATALTSPCLYRSTSFSTSLWSSSNVNVNGSNSCVPTLERRRELLTRPSPYFNLNRASGQIEFGATANLVTKFSDDPNAKEAINDWLSNPNAVATSIWDPSLIEQRSSHIYRLQVMTLQFVTLQLTPWIDIEMKTRLDAKRKEPVFTLQSVNFDPNIKVNIPLRRNNNNVITAESLGIVIQVVGELRLQQTVNGNSSSNNNNSVEGCIAFCTQGRLPAPMRILPSGVLRAASDAINKMIVRFAVSNFEKNARVQFNAYYKEWQKTKQQQVVE